MTAYATVAAVQARWIGLDPPEPEQIEVYLADVTALIDREFPTLRDRLGSTDAGGVGVDVARMVVCQVVLRKFYNPTGANTEGTGPFAATWKGDGTGQLQLTEKEYEILSGNPVESAGSAFTIDTTPQADGGWIGYNPWVQLANPDDPGWPPDGSVLTPDGTLTTP